MKYTVNKLAKFSGITVRTLHYYGEIGLLQPIRGANNYRYYGESELLRLQQILIYRELDVPLEIIKDILDKPGFDDLSALIEHKNHLLAEQKRLDGLIKTIVNTIKKLKRGEPMTAQKMYGGLTKKQMEEYQKEAEEKWGNTDAYRQSVSRVKAMGKAGLQKVGEDMQKIEKEFADLLGEPLGSGAVQAVVAKHRVNIANFYEVTDDIYSGLAHMYVQDPRFKAHFEQIKPGLAEFVSAAILTSLK